jgi:Mn-dependent DtxR family transcriptional regulator
MRGKAQNTLVRICERLAQGPATLQQLAVELNVHEDCVNYALHRLRKTSFIEWTGEKTLTRTRMGSKFWRLVRPFDREEFRSALTTRKAKPIFHLEAIDSVFANWMTK